MKDVIKLLKVTRLKMEDNKRFYEENKNDKHTERMNDYINEITESISILEKAGNNS